MNDSRIVATMDEKDTVKVRNAKKLIYLFIKRMFDIIFSLLGIVMLIPIALVVKVCYMLTGDFHRIFFTQNRIGKDGKEFKFYKFRSMVPNADEVLKELLKDKELKKEYRVNKKLRNDPRITKIGKLLRRTSLDELPQVINIFKGEMSVIGNRPYLPREKEDMTEFFEEIVKTKPGLTGYWQVSGRSDTSFRRRMELESYYSNNYGLKLDIKIFFKTIRVVLFGSGAQ